MFVLLSSKSMFFFQAEDGIRDLTVTGVQTCALRSPDVLRRRWQRLLELPPQERLRAFGPTRDRDLSCTPADLLDPNARLPPLRELREGAVCLEPVRYAYRSFDRQWVLPDARLGDFMRPGLWRIAGPRQTFLTSLLTNVLGSGPAAVATAYVPDLD